MTVNALIFADLLQQVADPDQLSWEQLRPGVQFHALYGRPDEAPAAALLRYAPGATVPKHRHPAFEHILVLEGSQQDSNGVHTAGTLLVSPPGTAHAVTSENGCIALAIWAATVDFGE
ncbi:MAG: cupin domain-containing protein [Gammaproteobacteria bacterium]|nr:cupin domain-containing protein [Gammaproteobacteria bacterium]